MFIDVAQRCTALWSCRPERPAGRRARALDVASRRDQRRADRVDDEHRHEDRRGANSPW